MNRHDRRKSNRDKPKATVTVRREIFTTPNLGDKEVVLDVGRMRVWAEKNVEPGPIGRFLRRTTLRENKRGPLIFRPRPANGTGKFWDTEDIETGFRTLSGRFLGSCKAETQPPLKRTIWRQGELGAQL